MKQFFCELLFTCTMLAPVGQPIEDLTYGTVLFDYYQEDYQQALLTALVAEGQNRRGDDHIKFDLATGSFAFADGLYGYANSIFEAVPTQEMGETDRLRLAFHLSREFHRRQDWGSLEQQLAKIELGKTRFFGRQLHHPEVEFMRAELAVNRKEFTKAEEHFVRVGQEHPLAAYGRFNLGIAYREAGLLPQAQSTFQALSSMPAYSDEAYDLTQRARLALALIARQQQQSKTAETVLADLPAQGRYQEVAMAAFGGLAMDNADYELAARIWMNLQQEEYWTASTATARLGFPLSLEKMAANGQTTPQVALHQFEQAQASFESRMAVLTNLTTQAEDPKWIQGLLQVFAAPKQDEDQMRVLMGKWQKQLGHTDWLEWLATEEVHELLTQWRDLNDMEAWLNNLPDHVDALHGVALEQERRGQQARAMLHDDGLLQQRQRLVEQIETQAETLRFMTSEAPRPDHAWMHPLATDEERATLDDLRDMSDMLVHMSEKDQVKWQQRIARLEGVFFFRLVAERAERLQRLRKSHSEMASMVAEIDARIQRVASAEKEFAAGVGTAFAGFLDRADELQLQVANARLSREQMLASEIRGRMQDEQRQVAQYLLVTRIAIARATDQLAFVAGEERGFGVSDGQ
ncbi:MAG: hypothetical protein AAF541_14900 [Pseudomonadota bacterium]